MDSSDTKSEMVEKEIDRDKFEFIKWLVEEPLSEEMKAFLLDPTPDKLVYPNIENKKVNG